MNIVIKNRGLLLKFTEPRFIESTRKGVFHFTNLKRIKELEDDGSGIGDPHEGKTIIHANEKTTLYARAHDDYDSDPIQIPITSGTLEIEHTATDNVSICSFAFLSVDTDFDFISETKCYRIKPKIINDLKNICNGRPAIVLSLTSLYLFWKKPVIEKYPLVDSFAKGKITYTDDRHLPIKKLTKECPLEVNDILEIAFKKDKAFSNQHEFRLALYLNEPNRDIDMGDISDLISVIPNLATLRTRKFKFVDA